MGVHVCIIVVDIVVCVVMLGMYDCFYLCLGCYYVCYILCTLWTPGRLVVTKASANGDPSNK